MSQTKSNATGNDDKDRLLKPTEVAARLRVNPKTVARWAESKKLTLIRTPGGHRRYRESEIDAIVNGTIYQDKEANQ